MENEKRFVAIMFTDLKGYSALTQKNENLALEVLDIHTKALKPVFRKFQGRVVKTIGDAFMVEFADGLRATLCAIEMQQKIHAENKKIEKQKRMLMRIGIHQGEVVIKNGDLFGDDVNIAARLEPLAAPGKICISKQVMSSVKSQVDFVIRDIGKQKLKNISSAVQVYEIDPYKKKNIFRTIFSNIKYILGLIVLLAGFYLYKNPTLFDKYAMQFLNMSNTSKDLSEFENRILFFEQAGFDTTASEAMLNQLKQTNVSRAMTKNIIQQLEERLLELELELASQIEQRKSIIYQRLSDKPTTAEVDNLLKQLDQQIQAKNWKEAHNILIQLESTTN